jgi:predicted nucleotidyltransferase component of viral defense system
MKDYCLELAAKQTTPAAKYNIMREYAQAYVLKIMQETGVFQFYAFVGGTALRFLYDLPRFSEDLDFSLCRPSGQLFKDLMGKIRQELTLAGYTTAITYSDQKAVQSAFIKFEGLLFEAGLSALKAEKFSIKLEVDSEPPAGAVVVNKIVNKFFPLAFLTYDLPSLFAGKIHAVLSRKYVKGRDYYDIFWYLSRHKELEPNFILLSSALKQTGWKGKPVTKDNWRLILSQQVKAADWAVINRDTTNFLEMPSDMKVLTQENVLKIIGEKY